MKCREKSLKFAMQENLGEEELKVISVLRGKKNVSEFIIANKLKADVNRVRSVLYTLQNRNLANYIRKKDKVKGWSVSYWSFNLSRVRDMARAASQKKLDGLRAKLRKEKEHQYYICPENCMRMTFDSAVDFCFRCPECGKLMKVQDNKDIIKTLEKEITRITA